MASYKEASERMNMTGNGLEGLEHINFQDYIVKNICRYYFMLDPVLKNRPNVTPWFTNEEDTTPKNSDNIFLSSDDDDDSNGGDGGDTKHKKNTYLDSDSDCEVVVDKTVLKKNRQTDIVHDEYELASVVSNHLHSTNTDNDCNSSTNSDDSNSINQSSPTLSTTFKKRTPMIVSVDAKSSCPSSSTSNSYQLSSPCTSSSSNVKKVPKTVAVDKRHKKKKKQLQKNSKSTPSQAKKLQKSMLNKKRKSIAKMKESSSLTHLSADDHEEKLIIEKTRQKRMMFEQKKHEDLTTLEEKKINIELERLNMERNTMKLTHQNMIIKNNLEKSRIVLLRLEMFKNRQSIKLADPSVDDDYLNKYFPFPDEDTI